MSMRILFATGHGYPSDRLGGGAGHSVHALLEFAEGLGHHCEVAAALMPGPRYHCFRALRWLSGRHWTPVWREQRNGYDTRRTIGWVVPNLVRERIRAFRPDVVFTQLELCENVVELALDAGLPAIVRVPDTDFHFFSGRLKDKPVLYLSNSRFVAARLRERFGVESEVLYPIVRPERYETVRPDPGFITLVNPTPKKGLDLALEIAGRLPHRRFLFQESGRLDRHERRGLRARLAAHPNITFRHETPSMREVYAQTLALLVPSRWDEPFCRVILEAQASGIPILARAVGGIPETLSEGGILLPAAAQAEAWAETLERLLSDLALYDRLSAAARRNVRRAAFAPAALGRRFLALAAAHVTRSRLATVSAVRWRRPAAGRVPGMAQGGRDHG